jgi:class 3 adenylate cyclase
MNEIAKLAAASADVAAGAGPVSEPKASAGRVPSAAERRQLTVMFCDLAGSTALSARLDLEEMREVIRAYQEACSGVVARYDGLVAKFMGDGILAYFGFPRAHEDDAEQAVRAGLEIAARVPWLESRAGETLAARIGVATGRVVVGDLIGQGSAQEHAVVGETPNLAARLQALAEPGGVLIADSTRRLLGDAFELKDLGEQELKGFAARTRVFAVLHEKEDVSRFEATRAQRMTLFVGREPEVALLLDRWRDASAGKGKVALHARLLLQPVARRRLGAVGAVQAQSSLKLGHRGPKGGVLGPQRLILGPQRLFSQTAALPSRPAAPPSRRATPRSRAAAVQRRRAPARCRA